MEPNLRTLAQEELAGKLGYYLFHVRERLGEDAFPRSAGEYLDEWAAPERGWPRKYYPEIRTYRLLGSTTEKLLGHGHGQDQDHDHDRRLHPAGVGFVALKAKRYRWLGPARRYLCEFGRPIHPGWRRCSSSQYVEYSPSSRLASRAPRPPKFTHLSSRGS